MADDSLTVGDEAPAIEISHWLKGEPVEKFEEGQVYVVEFWATWCGPCRASMPHLSELQKQYEDYDVTIIGVSDEVLPTVVRFLSQSDAEDKLWYNKIDYTLATDPDESVYNAYMKASGQRGIPTSFIVGTDGHIEWIGHPMGIDEALDSVVKDTWDRTAFKAEYESKMVAQREAAKAQEKISAAYQAGDYETVITYLDQMLDSPENKGNVNLEMSKFTIMLTKMEDIDGAYAFAGDMVDRHFEDSMALNAISWFIVDEADLPHRDLDLAMKAAKQASTLTDHKDGAILDTLARCYYEQGNLKKAVEWQRKAVENANPQMAADLKKVLEKYEKEAK
ncbi:MAG: redoxin domain-containing protein, partial [Planctomycetota bacterium]